MDAILILFWHFVLRHQNSPKEVLHKDFWLSEQKSGMVPFFLRFDLPFSVTSEKRKSFQDVYPSSCITLLLSILRGQVIQQIWLCNGLTSFGMASFLSS